MDGQIINNDVRISSQVVGTYKGHTGEVCGLKWSGSGQQLASGGNDNLVHLWDRRSSDARWLHRLKGKLDFGKKKAKESSQSSNMNKKAASVGRDFARASSSSVAEFTVLAKKSSLVYIAIPASVAKDHMPEERTTFQIHHPDMKNSWNVVYLKRDASSCFPSIFSGGWRRVAKEYPIGVGDICKFTFIKPTELLLVVSKPSVEETH